MVEETCINYHFAEKPKDVPYYPSSESATKIDLDTPKIPFFSLNNLLQRNFYKLCPPILLRQLFLSSKTMEKFKCPTYIANNTEVHSQRDGFLDKSGTLDPAAVIEIRGSLSLRELFAGDLSKYFSNHIFHQTGLEIMNSDPEEVKIVCNSSITKFSYVAHTSEDGIFTTYLERMPNLKLLTYRVRTSIPDLMSGLCDWKQNSKLEYLEIICDQWSVMELIDSPELIYAFMKRQEKHLLMVINYWSNKDLRVSGNFLEYFCNRNHSLKTQRRLVLVRNWAGSCLSFKLRSRGQTDKLSKHQKCNII